MSSHSFELIGIGNPIMDLLAHVQDSFLKAQVAGEKAAWSSWMTTTSRRSSASWAPITP